MSLKEIREEKNLKQNAVAAAIGVTPQAVCNYENGTRMPKITTLKKMADVYGVTVDELAKAITDDDEARVGSQA